MTGYGDLSLTGLRRVFQGARHGLMDWFWTRYHERRQQKLHEVFHTVFTSDQAFLEAVDTLDEFQRWDLSKMISARIQTCRADDWKAGLSTAERERLQRQRVLLMDRLERGRTLLEQTLMRGMH